MSDLLNKASLVMIPSGYKEDVVYSAVPSDGSGDLAFSRASNGTRVNSAGLVEVCPWNLLRQSNTFSSSPWGNSGATLTSGQTDPNGGANAWKVELAAGSSYLYQPSILVTGVVTMSAYLRADSTTTIGFNDGSAYPNSVTIGTTWQRYEFSFNVTSTNTAIQFDNYFGVSPATLAKTFYIYGAQLNIGSTAKPYFPTTDRLNVPRLTYQNGGGGCPSLLLEKQSTNISNYNESSSAFNAAIVTSASDLLGMKSYNVEADYSSGDAPNVPCSDFIANTTYTSSMYIDFNSLTGTQFIVTMLGFFPSVEFATMTVNKSTKAITSSTSGGGIWTINAAKIEHQKDEIYRVILTATPNTTGGGARTYVDSGNFESVNVAGIQVEASSYATSVILKTTSASATRVADACFKTGISSLIGQTEGVMFVDVIYNGSANTGEFNRIINITDGSSSNFISLSKNNSTDELYVYCQTSAGVQVNSGAITGTSLIGRHKIALAYKANDFVLYVDGIQKFVDTSASVPTCSRLNIGSLENFFSSTDQLGGSVSEAILFPTRLSNSELASLTTI